MSPFGSNRILNHFLNFMFHRLVGAKTAPSIAGEVHSELSGSADQVCLKSLFTSSLINQSIN